MFKNFKTSKRIQHEIEKLNEAQLSIQREKAELKEMENSIRQQLNDLYGVIDDAKEYLSMCGITEKDLERIMTKNRIHIIK